MHNTEYIDNRVSNKKVTNENSFEYEYRVDSKEIVQWAVNNTGYMPKTVSNTNAWEWDEKKAVNGYDISYIDTANKSKRECIVALIDTEINAYDTSH